MRRLVLRALSASMVYGGMAPRRPDQVEPSSPAGVAPGTATGTFRGRLVEVFGTGPGATGLFVYDGVPGLGNPPQVAIVNSSTTKDPFGNAIGLSKILLQSNIITESGGIFRTAAAAPLMQMDGPHNAFLAYDAATLRESIAPVQTNDGLGSVVPAGFVSYGAASTTWARLFQQLVAFHMPADTFDALVGENGDGSLSVQSATRAGANLTSLTLTPGASVTALDGRDGNNYDTERLSKFLAADTPVAISTNVTLFSKPVAAGTYAIDGIIKGVQGAAAVGQGVQFASTGAASVNDIYIESNAVGNTSVTDSDLTGAFPVAHLTPAWVAGTTFYVRFRGIFTVAAGTFSVVGQGAAGGAWTAKAASLFSLYPVVAT